MPCNGDCNQGRGCDCEKYDLKKIYCDDARLNTEETNVTKHKWHDEIVAWAGGEKIEVCKAGIWYETDYPDFHHTGLEFRIKPQPKEPKYLYVFHNLDEGKYEIGEKPHPQMNYRTIIGKIEVQND